MHKHISLIIDKKNYIYTDVLLIEVSGKGRPENPKGLLRVLDPPVTQLEIGMSRFFFINSESYFNFSNQGWARVTPR